MVKMSEVARVILCEAQLNDELLEKLISMSADWEAEGSTYGYRKNDRGDIEGNRIFLAERDGASGSGSNITITGSAEVTAQGGTSGSGIGGGYRETGSNITVSEDAQVKAQGGKSGKSNGSPEVFMARARPSATEESREIRIHVSLMARKRHLTPMN